MLPETTLALWDVATQLARLAFVGASTYAVIYGAVRLGRFTGASGWGQVVVFAGGGIAGFLTFGIGLLWLIFSGPAPEESGWGRLGKERAVPVLQALERYKAERGVFPGSLQELVPSYLPDGPRVREAFAALGNFGEWQYFRPEPSAFELSFRFKGPGNNYCAFLSDRAQWHCAGYF